MSQLVILKRALTLTEKLIFLVENEAWDEMETLAKEHADTIYQLHMVDVAVEESAEATQKMLTLMALNKQLQSRCVEKRGQSMSNLSQMNQGSKMTSAYLAI